MGLLEVPSQVLGGILDPIAAKIANPFSRGVNGALAPDFPEGFQFTEIVNGREVTENRVTLAGDMLPFQPFPFGGTQKLVKEYYPGNPEPAVQVLGARENDLVVKGKLKDKRYKSSALQGASKAMQEQIDLVRRRGNLLRITLGQWQRFGFLEECNFKLNRLSEIEYELKFSIMSHQAPKNCKLNKSSKNLPLDLNSSLLAAAVAFQQTYSAVPSSMPASISDILNGAISDVASAIGHVTNFVDTVITTGENIIQSANRAIGLIKNARASLSRYRRRIGAISLSMGSLSSEASSAANFKSAISSQAHIMSSVNAANSLSSLLAQLQKQFEVIAKAVPIARYKVVSGDTLQKVAIKFYQNADLWKRIYDHNKLTSTELTAGAILEIPRA